MSRNPKVLLTWCASPEDPHYWEYFKIPGLVVSLKSLINLRSRNLRLLGSLMYKGFKRTYGYKGFLIVDSLLNPLYKGLGELKYKQSDILYLQYIIGSDILVNKDYPLVGIRDPTLRDKLFRRTLISAEAAMKFSEKLGKEVMLVIQGWDEESYVKCAMLYRDLGAKYFGIGSMVPHKHDPSFVSRVVRKIREVLGWGSYIHVFGLGGISVLKRIRRYIDSVDVSTPIRAASNREILVVKKDKIARVKISRLDGIYIIKTLVERARDPLERELLNKVVSSRSFTTQKKYSALYNAYSLIKIYVGASSEKGDNDAERA